ncbi:MAG: hypothetical protein OEZ68_04310 [Gammaproteobacteria bacterium]|nr:hypothetical protein [Gammaproteobacteria bacterium]MDH5800011.1 hypothetical protein [Gammaproteobacteria bacterium]
MKSDPFQALNNFLQSRLYHIHCRSIAADLDDLVQESEPDTDKSLALYEQVIPMVEKELWCGECDKQLQEQYSSICREMENHIAGLASDTRHNFIIVIPVADRPRHLEICLNSLLELCGSFNYGGRSQQAYNKVSVVIADDSQSGENIRAHHKLAEAFTKKGLTTKYLGADEQYDLASQVLKSGGLGEVLGKFQQNRFYHKGASITRNIAYLYLRRVVGRSDNTLIYFIDSDQEFRLNCTVQKQGAQEQDVMGLNTFYHLDRLFSKNDIKVLTGKVVGDPPVSPSVMAGKLLNDILDFLEQIASVDPETACLFHHRDVIGNDDAAYHDMAALFGYASERTSYRYACTQTGEHNNGSCFARFANQLQRFFDGEHPTRHMFFHYENIDASLKPARTVYTGNYVIQPEMLDWFIPFANLKLRMAGPVLGRLLRSDVGDQFVTANLPMLHKRTVEEKGRSEYRPGIARTDENIDLSGEFERQFFGDVMLFSIDDLTRKGYPSVLPKQQEIETTILSVEDRLLQQYADQHEHITKSLEQLFLELNKPEHWWNVPVLQETLPELDAARRSFNSFVDNMQLNFGESAITYRRIQDSAIREEYRTLILDAILSYPRVKTVWRELVSSND